MPTKRPITPEDIEHILDVVARNLDRLMKVKYPNEANKRAKLSKDSGVGRTTLNQVLLRRQFPRLDNILRWAWALDEPVWQLLVPARDLSRVFDTTNVAALEALAEDAKDLKRSRSR